MSSEYSVQKKSRFELLDEFASAPDAALFKQETLCAIRDCSSATVERDRCIGGGVPFIRIGRSVRYRKSDIVLYINEQLARSSTSSK